MSDVIRHVFSSSDVGCVGYHYRAHGRSPAAPIIVMGHGFGGIQEGALARTAMDFAKAGFHAFTFDYRRFGESGGTPRQVISIRDQQADWHAAISFALGLDGVEVDRLCLWGSSLSGAHVIEVALNRDDVRAIIAQVPWNGPACRVEGRTLRNNLRLLGRGLNDWVRGKLGKSPAYVPTVGSAETGAVIVSPRAEMLLANLESRTWRNEVAPRIVLEMPWYRPSRHVHRLTAPLLVCLAEHDQHTPAQLSRKIADRAPFGELRRYPCTHFDFYSEEIRRRLVQDQVSFLVTHLNGFTSNGDEGSFR